MLGMGQAGSRHRRLHRPGSPMGPDPAPSTVTSCLLPARSPLAAPRRICSLCGEAGAIKPRFNFALARDGEGNRAANHSSSLHASCCRQSKRSSLESCRGPDPAAVGISGAKGQGCPARCNPPRCHSWHGETGAGFPPSTQGIYQGWDVGPDTAIAGGFFCMVILVRLVQHQAQADLDANKMPPA